MEGKKYRDEVADVAEISDVTMLFKLCSGEMVHLLSDARLRYGGSAAEYVFPKSQCALSLDKVVQAQGVLSSGLQSAGLATQDGGIAPLCSVHGRCYHR